MDEGGGRRKKRWCLWMGAEGGSGWEQQGDVDGCLGGRSSKEESGADGMGAEEAESEAWLVTQMTSQSWQ